MTVVKAPRATELACQATIVAAAKRAGWRVHATRAAQTGGRWSTPIQGHSGFVDLVLVRDGVAVFCELKRRPNKVEPEQRVWHTVMRHAGLTVGILWVPEGMPAFIAYLTGGGASPLEVPA